MRRKCGTPLDVVHHIAVDTLARLGVSAAVGTGRRCFFILGILSLEIFKPVSNAILAEERVTTGTVGDADRDYAKTHTAEIVAVKWLFHGVFSGKGVQRLLFAML